MRRPNLAQRKRRHLDRDARNAEARVLLPASFGEALVQERKARAERTMAAHDAELAKRLGL